MKILKDILKNIQPQKLVGVDTVSVNTLQLDSRKVGKGDVFFAIKGTVVDGHAYLSNVIEQGVSVIVCETMPAELHPEVTYVEVKDARRASAVMACNYYDHPSESLKLVGVTGTNGKTSVATLLHQIYTERQYKVGLLSTIVNKINQTEIPSTHTTPDPIAINALLRRMANEGVQYAFMEVSSHAADQDRVFGLHFAGGIFTNITHDHLDYHKGIYLREEEIFRPASGCCFCPDEYR